MYWIPFLLLGLNLGCASAGFCELFGRQYLPKSITKFDRLLKKLKVDYVKQIDLAKQKLAETDDKLEIMEAFAEFEPIASHMTDKKFDCSSKSVADSLKNFRRMRKLLVELCLLNNDELSSRYREHSSRAIVQSSARMESAFLKECLDENRSEMAQIRKLWKVEMLALGKFKAATHFPIIASSMPLEEQASIILQDRRYQLSILEMEPETEEDMPTNLSQAIWELCEIACSNIDAALKDPLEKGLLLLGEAESVGLDIDGKLDFDDHLNYLLCTTSRSHLSSRAAGVGTLDEATIDALLDQGGLDDVLRESGFGHLVGESSRDAQSKPSASA